MAHLDDFIREQFQQDDPAGRFPFREDYWEQALPLIAAAERQRRRRRLLWWWFSGLLLLGSGWWGWHLFHRPATLGQPVGLQQSPLGGVVPGVAQPGGTAGSRSGTASAAGTPVVVSEYMESQHFNTSKNNSSGSPQRALKTVAPSSTRPKKGTGKTTAKGQLPAAPEPSTFNLPDPTVPLAFVPAAPQEVPVSTAQGENTQVTVFPTLTAGSPVKSATWQPMFRLSTPFEPLVSGMAGFAVAQVPFHFPRIRPVREPVFAVGLHASATVYRPAPSGRTTGATVGMDAEYWLRPAWSISAGLAGREQPVADTLVIGSYQLHYRFGYEEEKFRREDRSLQVLEIPLGLHWHHRIWEIETGVTFGQVLRVRAVQIQTSRSSLFPLPQETKTPIKGQQDSYRRRYTGIFAGAGWQPLHQLQLEVRGTYRPASLLKTNGENAARQGGFWLDAGLCWQLFSNERIRIRR